MSVNQMDAKDLVGVISNKNLGELRNNMLNVRLGFIGGKAVVPREEVSVACASDKAHDVQPTALFHICIC